MGRHFWSTGTDNDPGGRISDSSARVMALRFVVLIGIVSLFGDMTYV